jgi:2-hydroxy-4-carboxymuconate semialdehyde hemiacetal dehydrogenase
LADPVVEVVVIASPNAAHFEQARAAIAAGKHVLIEIPIALNLAEAEELARLAAGSGAVVMAAHISRYYPPVRRLRRMVAAGELTLRHLVCAMGTDKRENRNQAGELRDWVDDLMWHHGLHVLDVVMHLFPGDTVEDAGLTLGARHPEHGGLMDASIAVRFAGGALATVALTYNAKAQFTRYTVVADERFEELAQDALGVGRTDLTGGRPFAELVDDQAGEFLAACLAGGPAPIPLEAVLPAMRLLASLDHVRSSQAHHA